MALNVTGEIRWWVTVPTALTVPVTIDPPPPPPHWLLIKAERLARRNGNWVGRKTP